MSTTGGRSLLLGLSLCLSLPVSLSLSAAPYTYFGGEVDSKQKNAAIEQCEYRVLVEEQRCNKSLNKSQCIRDVHAECIEAHDPVQAKPSEPGGAGKVDSRGE